MFEESRQREVDYLKMLKRERDPQKVLYPGSGFDQTIREIFGKKRCVYISLSDSDYYFENNPPDVIADYRFNPFPDNTFDMIYIHGTPIITTIQAVPEFTRVLKFGGVIVGALDYSLPNQEKLISALKNQESLVDISTLKYSRVMSLKYHLMLTEDVLMVVDKKNYQVAVKMGFSTKVFGHKIVAFEKRYAGADN